MQPPRIPWAPASPAPPSTLGEKGRALPAKDVCLWDPDLRSSTQGNISAEVWRDCFWFILKTATVFNVIFNLVSFFFLF